MATDVLGSSTVRKRIYVEGIVQGVGFRPYSSEGVFIEVEGARAAIDGFVGRMSKDAPALAQIDHLSVMDVPTKGSGDFVILDSADAPGQFVLVPADVGTCEDCYSDFTDPSNRRYAYPFTNCTNCGPRYTIIEDIPYDRPATTMAQFEMCPKCRAEYENPADRRFHAQPNACPECGPSLSVSLGEVRQWLREGRIVAIKGLGGFHLACDAENDAAVRLLRERKRKSDKPFALMAPDLAAIEQLAFVSEAERQALAGPRRPIVILQRRPGSPVSDAVAPGNTTIGVMLPYTPLHHLLFEPEDGARFQALVMTSGNLKEEPIVSREDELTRLAPLVDGLALHNRRIQTRVDDSVVRVMEGGERVLRRSRGYAPQPIDLGMELGEIVACGGELKNTLCLTKQHYAILSQHIGDLENYETLVFFEETLAHMKRFFRVDPRVVAYDLHPGYLSTRFALEMGDVRKIGVQHHHAHIASCMAENGLRGKVIGVALDGTGYGTDGRIWGGEFLVCDYTAFERRAHFRYVPLAGGDAAVRQPWRSALSYLRDTFGTQVPAAMPLFRRVPVRVRLVAESMLARGVNTVRTSSCGRLFDAVASILDIRHDTDYDGQAAIELEARAGDCDAVYPFDVYEDQVDFRAAIQAMVRGLGNGDDVASISAAFHNTVAAAVVEVCCRVRRSDRLQRVCLSGGTFQNARLLKAVVAGLRSRDFEVFLHERVPPNDGGISLGQAVIASARGGQ